MSKMIIAGHGGYGTAIKKCLEMLLGETPGMFYVDFNAEDDLSTLGQKLQDTIKQCGEDRILFACDLAGGSPFRQCAMICVENPTYIAVAGLNIGAYGELANNLDLTVKELADMAIETAHAAILRYPEK